ncbi:MAG: molybdopterin oxidoreductase, partial [Halanaeroarchaeum sp.]
RFNIVVPPLVLPVMDQLPSGDYFPSLVEWATSFGIVALGLLLYTIGAEILPLTPIEDGDHE